MTLTEEDFRKRKPHPNFKNQTEVEKNVTKLGKDGTIKTYVVASGVPYHADESLFHQFFKVRTSIVYVSHKTLGCMARCSAFNLLWRRK